jgi:allophanate hydrolase subunit 2
MGLRLRGQPISLPGREMISEPVCPGSVQVANDGQCIVLGVDGQTIGGYPKIAQVIQADLDALGQLRPGQTLRFAKVALEEATRRDRERLAFLREWTLRLRLSLDAFSGERRFA